MLTLFETALFLGVKEDVLINWETQGNWIPYKSPISNNRLYDEREVKLHAEWFKIVRRHKQHLRKLKVINKNLQKYLAVTPIAEKNLRNYPGLNLEKLKKAINTRNKWNEEYLEIKSLYSKFAIDFIPKVNLD